MPQFHVTSGKQFPDDTARRIPERGHPIEIGFWIEYYKLQPERVRRYALEHVYQIALVRGQSFGFRLERWDTDHVMTDEGYTTPGAALQAAWDQVARWEQHDREMGAES